MSSVSRAPRPYHDRCTSQATDDDGLCDRCGGRTEIPPPCLVNEHRRIIVAPETPCRALYIDEH